MDGPLAIEDVTVIPMDADRRLTGQTVLVRDGRIAAITPRETAQIPKDAVRVSGSGRFLMPGLAEGHGHLRNDGDFPLFLAFGVTTIRNLMGNPFHLRLIAAVDKGELVGPTINTVGPVTDGPPTMRPWAIPVADRADAERVVGWVQRSGYSGVKIYDHLMPQGYDGIMDVAAERSFPVVGHIPFNVGLEHALRKKQRCIEHSYGYIEACQPLGSPLRERKINPAQARMALSKAPAVDPDDPRIDELVALTKAAGTWNAPTMMIRRRHLQSIEELDARDENRFIDRTTVDDWRAFKRTYPYDLAHKGHELAVQHAIVRKLTAAGAGVMAGTDAPVHYLVPGASLHEEILEMRRAGLTPFQALQTATTNVARFFGQDKEWGVVSVGARADLLLLDADPLADVANTRRIVGVVVRGKWLPATTLRDRAGEAVERSGWRPRSLPTTASTSSGTRSFTVSWDRVEHGWELVSSDAAHLRAEADVEAFLHLGLVPDEEAGRFRFAADVSTQGVERAYMSSETLNGVERVLVTRSDGRLDVVRKDPVLGIIRESHRAEAATLIGRPSTGVFELLARRLRDLELGGSRVIELFGPGTPPDYEMGRTELRCWRIESDGGGRRYSFRATRPNATYAGILDCDDSGSLSKLHLIAAPSELGNQVTDEPPSLEGAGSVVEVRRVDERVKAAAH